jgi:uncharacterized protein
MAHSAFLTAEWRKLAIANYLVDKNVLQKYLPYKTELDTWNGDCYVSLVGFMFLNTKLRGWRIPFHQNFEEVNLRFYVRYNDNGVWKRGVTFIKEIVPKHALTFVANNIYKEKYETMPMKHTWLLNDNTIDVEYKWKKGNWHSFKIEANLPELPLVLNSKEEFITEHFWGYTHIGLNLCSEYEVQHPRWAVYDVVDYTIDVDFEKIYGKEFSFLNNINPKSVMLAEGSDIIVKSASQLK